MKKTYIIDRFEENLAMCEDETKHLVPIPRETLPAGAKEGDLLSEEDGRFTILVEETKKRRQAMRERLEKLYK